MLDLQQLINGVYDDLQSSVGQGRVADYIPELAKVDPRKFGIAVTTLDGETVSVGDADELFLIQSISRSSR